MQRAKPMLPRTSNRTSPTSSVSSTPSTAEEAGEADLALVTAVKAPPKTRSSALLSCSQRASVFCSTRA